MKVSELIINGVTEFLDLKNIHLDTKIMILCLLEPEIEANKHFHEPRF